MASVGIRELKNNLSHYVKQAAAGKRVTVTDRGVAVAELMPVSGSERGSRYEELVAEGLIRPALESGDPLADFPRIKLPRGTVAALIDEDRGGA